MNKIILMGRTTHDIEVLEIGKGKEKKKVTNFSLAVPRVGTEETDFINCVAWEKKAEILEEYVAKGQRVLIEGHLQVNKYEDDDGNNRTATKVVVTNIEFADKSKESDKKKVNKYDKNF